MIDLQIPAGAERSQLLKEIVAAAPGLVTISPEGDRSANFEMRTRDGETILRVPEEFAAAVEAAIAAHVPQPPPVDPRKLAARAVRDATTIGQLKAGILDYMRADGVEP